MTSNRVKHSISVAEFMLKFATEMGWNTELCQDMFILGLLHDIGYRFTTDPSKHPNIGGDILRRLGYKHWKEVKYHGIVNITYRSKELDLLNIADLNIDSSGNDVGVEKRLLDIQSRYGESSKQYIEAKELAKELNVIS